MNVVVTGGAGYIGSHTCKALALAGHRPIVFDNLSQGHRSAVKWGPLFQGELEDGATLRRILDRSHAEAVIHFAAHAYVDESIRHPRKYFHNNVVNSFRLIEAVHDVGIPTFVFSSSCAIYGVPLQTPIPETHPHHPISPYGESKLFVERALRWSGEADGLRWMALRYFNAAGADPEGEIGESHEPETHIIPLAVGAALGEHPRFDLYGTDHPTPDGTAIRDYIHVSDLARAHVLALEYLAGGGEERALNLGTGTGYSVRDVIACVERVTGRSVPVRERPRRRGDPPTLVADARRAGEILGWSPECEDLEAIIAGAAAWQSPRPRRAVMIG
jgi:UDP-glucose-4-epimerase GalE